MIQTIQQKPTDLVLAITSEPLLDSIMILKEETVNCGRWSFTFGIIGESHVTTVRRDNVVQWHELLACIKIGEAQCKHYQPFRQLQPHQHSDVRYRVAVEFGPEPSWPGPDLSVTPYIEVAFPDVWGQSPVTRIAWDRQDDRMIWWTLHVYPECDMTTYVHSKSQLQLI